MQCFLTCSLSKGTFYRSSIESAPEIAADSNNSTEEEISLKELAVQHRRESVLESFEKNQVKLISSEILS